MINNNLRKKIKIMGVLNITPDSFSDGGIYYENIEAAVRRVNEMLETGADIIDIGGESSRPGATKVSQREELKRIMPVINQIRRKNKNIVLSVDTYNADTAVEVLEKGVSIINSLGGFVFDNRLANIAAKYKCKVIIYHIKGKPETMQKGEIAYNDIIEDIKKFFSDQIKYGLKNGMKRSQFMLDPGIGFGKTVEQNIELIKRLAEFKKFELPIVVGISRKSHLGAIMAKNMGHDAIPSINERVEAGLAETAIAVMNGADIVRTHDIIETKRFLSVLEEFSNSELYIADK